MASPRTAPKRIGELFYETRVLMGREFTLKLFADSVLGSSVDPVMLGYIEKGKRFPSEALVRRLATARKQNPRELLALLWRDRMLHGLGRELKRVLQAPRAVDGIEDAELAIRISQAIAGLPDDGSAIAATDWRRAFRVAGDRRSRQAPMSDAVAKQVETLLRERGLVEVKSGKARRRGRHFVAESPQERQALAIEFCGLFVKALLDKLALAEIDTGTYLRNHYLNIDSQRVVEFHERLDQAVRALAEEFAVDAAPTTRFMNVLLSATPL